MNIGTIPETLCKLAEDYDIIPLVKEINADVITPISLLKKIARRYSRFFLLESVEGQIRWGRYSFLGFNPLLRISCHDGTVVTEKGEAVHKEKSKSPYQQLRVLMSHYRAPRLGEDMPPFAGGLVGFFSYEMIGYTEPSLQLQSGEGCDFDFMLYDKVIAYDYLKQKIQIIVNIPTDNLEKNYEDALLSIKELSEFITGQIQEEKQGEKQKPKFTCNFTEVEFCSAVNRVRDYIFDGDIFQAVISRRFEATYHESLLNAYRVLRTTNPSPYMVFMQCDKKQIISASPETLIKLKEGKLSTFPIAGSRPRGTTKEEDQMLEVDLLHDEKELSEHNMLVDLARNDIGRIAKVGTVTVSKYKEVVRYSKIMHICSEVNGELREGLDAFDAINALLPAGTLSGAPKVRACEIIQETEPCPRGVYGGALGYIDFTGNMDTCIAIRMAVKEEDKVIVQAGAGIVADSVAEQEYVESENKAMAVMYAIQHAQEAD